MSRFLAHSRNAAEDRPAGRRPAGLRAGAPSIALALALPLAFGLAQSAAAQSNSGIYINNDVLNNLGPGPGAAPAAPYAPQPGYAPAPSYAPAPGYAPVSPTPQPGGGGLSFQTQGSGDYVVTRPGTLLFPPLQAPTSTLAPGFRHDNNAARSEALNKAFAGGPEPSSQLLIPLDDAPGGPIDQGDAVVIFEDNLPSADPQQQAQPGERIVLHMPANAVPPTPAPPKPAVPAGAMAEVKQADAQAADLAPEFQAPSPAEPAVTPAPAIADVEEKALAAEPSPQEPSSLEPASQQPAAAMASVGETPAPAEPAPAAQAPAPEPAPAPQVAATPAPMPTPAPAPAAPAPAAKASAPAKDTPTGSADMPAPVAMTEPTLTEQPAPAATSATAPVSLLPADNPSQPEAARPDVAVSAEPAGPAPGVQTASLSLGESIEDMTFLFDVDSAELSPETQAELRSLADALRSNESWIQVLGFAEGASGSEDQARKLALSRALKVRSFLIDAGIASKRIQVRSMGGRIGTGPANRVDIKPVGS